MTIPGRPEVRQLRTSLTRTVPRSLGPQNYQLFSSIRLSLAQSAAVSLNLGFVWIGRILTRADFGNSFAFSRPVRDVLWERVPRTMGIAFAGIALAWVIAVPIGIYSAVHQYSFLDYLFTFLGFIGLSIPAFLFAIVLVFIIYLNTGWAVTGIFSPEFEKAAWSLPKLFDMLKNLSVPLLVLSSSGAAG